MIDVMVAELKSDELVLITMGMSGLAHNNSLPLEFNEVW
jgi:hypothetical protein